MLNASAFIMEHRIYLFFYFMTLVNPKILTALILKPTIITITYIETKTTVTVFNKYHLWTKSASAVMTFWDCIKSILKTNKALVKITKTRSKLKTKAEY